ncbi:hypothetical protein ANCDUO_00206 [Ancylostoma duodenale]|uniref:Uncharacterized protein n=1 Tax=Ancylostoma duodenale TaxID=51022 RepID=A0A0C2DHN2_9BILA|nr:hypothetical protein ANCDUO_00206 [Ancylostoma duodenale]
MTPIFFAGIERILRGNKLTQEAAALPSLRLKKREETSSLYTPPIFSKLLVQAIGIYQVLMPPLMEKWLRLGSDVSRNLAVFLLRVKMGPVMMP